MIEVTFELYGLARQLAQTSKLPLLATQGTTVKQAIENLVQQFPDLEPLTKQSRWAIGVDFIDIDSHLDCNTTVVMIPPVSGG